MRLFVFGGRRLPFGLRTGLSVDLLEILGRLRGTTLPGGGPSGGTFLYVIQDGEGRCKVGVSKNPLQRLRELQTGHPARLELAWCAVTPGSGFAIEDQVERMEGLRAASGEWYRAHWRYMAATVIAAARYLGEALQEIPVDMVPQVVEQARREETPTAGAFPFRRPVLFVVSIWTISALAIFIWFLVSR